jgi:3-oxoacyl-[acyl-carrier-protein] synthase II
VQSTWRALLAGESGISTIDAEWVAKYELPVTFAGQAKVAASEVLTPQEAKRTRPIEPIRADCSARGMG